MFSSLDQLGERLRATGYIADSIGTTTVYLAAKLHKPLLLEARQEVARRNLHMRLPRRQIQALSACSVMRASTKKKPSANSMSRCRGFASS